jgi:hypothetical protein
MSGLAQQILSETPSTQAAPVNANSEQPTPQNPETQNPTDDFDSRFSVLTKMERRIKEQEGLYKSKAKEFEEKEKKLQEMEEFFKLMDENPLEAIKKRKGWGLQEINEFAVKHTSDDDLDPIAKIHKTHDEKMAALRKEMEEAFEAKLKAKEEEIRSKDYESQIKQFKSDIKTFIVENKQTYEFINADEGGMDTVYDVIYQDIQNQRESGVAEDQLRVMDLKDAADKVEAYLDNQYSKYLSLNKVRSRITNSDEDKIGQFITQSRPKTIDSSFSPKSKSTDQLSPEERRQAAIDLLKSQTAN